LDTDDDGDGILTVDEFALLLSGYGLNEYDLEETGAVALSDALKPYTTTLDRDQEGDANDYITIEVQPE